MANKHEVLITIEEGAVGGFGILVLQFLPKEGLLDNGLKVRQMCLPDFFIDHESQYNQNEEAGLNAPQIVATALTARGRDTIEEPARA